MNLAAARTLPCLLMIVAAGCRSGYYQSQGTGVGALGGAGVGALVGSATGNAGTGALIGAGVGALTGNVVGGAMDDVEARNRAQIAATMGRPVAAGAATPGEVIAMSRAGVDPQLMVNYINNSGVAQPASPQDVITMTQSGVPPMVIQAMQTPRVAQAPVAVVPPPPRGPVVVEEVYYGPPPCFGPPCWGPRPCGPRVGWGVSFSN